MWVSECTYFSLVCVCTEQNVGGMTPEIWASSTSHTRMGQTADEEGGAAVPLCLCAAGAGLH